MLPSAIAPRDVALAVVHIAEAVFDSHAAPAAAVSPLGAPPREPTLFDLRLVGHRLPPEGAVGSSAGRERPLARRARGPWGSTAKRRRRGAGARTVRVTMSAAALGRAARSSRPPRAQGAGGAGRAAPACHRGRERRPRARRPRERLRLARR